MGRARDLLAGAALSASLLGWACGAQAAACPAVATVALGSPATARTGQLMVPETAYLVSALPSLTRAGLSSADLASRASALVSSVLNGSAACTRPSFSVSGSTFVITGSDTDALPRVAVRTTGAGALAVLAPVPVLKTADGPRPLEPVSPSTVYVVATVSGTQVGVWAVFDGVPDDRLLAQVMQGALSGTGRPLLRFDPLYKPAANLTGVARYVLPPA